MIPLVMGVLNVTPDSFSDGGRYATVDAAVARAREMAAEGADVIDVGGESTRPGAAPVSLEEELTRVLPVFEAAVGDPACAGVRWSIDTRRPEVARAACAAGATLVNDVSSSLWPVAAECGAGWVAVHMAGEPATMQAAPHYEDVVGQVLAHLEQAAAVADAGGVEEVWIDPGIGFGKTVAHNLALLASLDRFVATGLPTMIGTSRKRTIGVLSARADARSATPPAGSDEVEPEPTATDDRLEGSLATATWAMYQGVRMVRAHDVRAHVHAAKVVAGEVPVA